MLEELLETWHTSNRINLLLIERISKEGMASSLSTRGGRDIARQFAHLHTQRIRWLEAKGGEDLTTKLPRFDSKEQPTKAKLTRAMKASAAAMDRCLREMASGERKVKGLKKGFVVAVGYLIAHESHHRGSILLTLKQRGHNLDKPTLYGIWDWQRI